MNRIISGIQQVGIGVSDATAAFAWYRKVFGIDTLIFKDEATASLMQRYTGNQAHDRLALLAMNLQSGGGFEVWQYTSRQPQRASFDLKPGDLGIYAVKIKSKNVTATYKHFQHLGVTLLTIPEKSFAGLFHFYLRDPFGNIFEITEDDYWFKEEQKLTGGVCGVVIGVTNLEKSIEFYRSIAGYDRVVATSTGEQSDLKQLPGASAQYKRVLLTVSPTRKGAFGKLLGPSFIELIEVTDRAPLKIYENRYWGDLGFIHVCYDVTGMDAHEHICDQAQFPLTVNSKNSFDMGAAAGHFAYNEDPDGTLIEYVETHRVPVLKKAGWYLNLRNRNPEKPLPDWMVKCLSFGKVRD